MQSFAILVPCRFIQELKKTLKNKAHVVDSICQSYIAQEINIFAKHYFEPTISCRRRRLRRNDKNCSNNISHLSLYSIILVKDSKNQRLCGVGSWVTCSTCLLVVELSKSISILQVSCYLLIKSIILKCVLVPTLTYKYFFVECTTIGHLSPTCKGTLLKLLIMELISILQSGLKFL